VSNQKTKKHDASRRDFVKKAAYVAPVILSLSAVSSVAKAGSEPRDPQRKPPKPAKRAK
jgi:hypothetical protein